jgi:hypothetical protein
MSVPRETLVLKETLVLLVLLVVLVLLGLRGQQVRFPVLQVLSVILVLEETLVLLVRWDGQVLLGEIPRLSNLVLSLLIKTPEAGESLLVTVSYNGMR